MPMLIHIVEIAALLAVAYAIGFALGYGGRRASLRVSVPAATSSAIPPERLAAAKGEGSAPELPPDPGVAAVGATLPSAVAEQTGLAASLSPSTAPVPPVSAAPAEAAAPSPTTDTVAPAPTPTTAEVPAPSEAPVPTATAPGPATRLAPEDRISAAMAEARLGDDARHVTALPPEPMSAVAAVPPDSAPVAAPGAPETQDSAALAAPETPPPARPSVRAPIVRDGWSVVPRPSRVEPLAAAPAPAEPGSEVAVDAASPSHAPGVAWAGQIRGRAAPAPDAPPPEPTPVPDTGATSAKPSAAFPEEPAAEPAPADPWSRRAQPNAALDLGAAVAAAQVAVEAALVKSGVDPAQAETREAAAFGKPDGLAGPLGRRDKLTEINGLAPSDESMLNGIGIFHFDQIAEWDQKEILWLENHLLERGRIAREGWQAQAAELMLRRAQAD